MKGDHGATTQGRPYRGSQEDTVQAPFVPHPAKGPGHQVPGRKTRSSVANLETCFVKNASIVERKIGDEFILVPIRQRAGEVESIYTLNEVAARVWELIDGQRRAGQIRDTIVAEFEVTPDEAEADVLEFLGQLAHVGAVKEA